ncbi:MAG: hypothetical protein ACK4KT_04755 [Thermaurantimonas sp.]
MINQFLGYFFFIVSTFALFVFYFIKVYWHYKLILVQEKKGQKSEAAQPLDLILFNWRAPDERSLRLKALWMYPLLFPVEIDPSDRDEVLRLKKIIKRWNIALYLNLIALFLSYIYISKTIFGAT